MADFVLRWALARDRVAKSYPWHLSWDGANTLCGMRLDRALIRPLSGGAPNLRCKDCLEDIRQNLGLP